MRYDQLRVADVGTAAGLAPEWVKPPWNCDHPSDEPSMVGGTLSGVVTVVVVSPVTVVDVVEVVDVEVVLDDEVEVEVVVPGSVVVVTDPPGSVVVDVPELSEPEALETRVPGRRFWEGAAVSDVTPSLCGATTSADPPESSAPAIPTRLPESSWPDWCDSAKEPSRHSVTVRAAAMAATIGRPDARFTSIPTSASRLLLQDMNDRFGRLWPDRARFR